MNKIIRVTLSLHKVVKSNTSRHLVKYTVVKSYVILHTVQIKWSKITLPHTLSIIGSGQNYYPTLYSYQASKIILPHAFFISSG